MDTLEIFGLQLVLSLIVYARYCQLNENQNLNIQFDGT